MKTIQNYNSIDLMKFVMAIAVVTIHTYIVNQMAPSLATDLVHAWIWSAVPFFFMVSAYFMQIKLKTGGQKLSAKNI